MNTDHLALSIRRVVDSSQTCSGCGACALVSDRVTMQLDDSGNLRPTVAARQADTNSREEHKQFERVCPGVRVTSERSTAPQKHSVFGGYVSAWEAVAIDDETRFAGSSAGVITAMTEWLRSTGVTTGTIGAAADGLAPRRTIAVQIQTRDEALRAAGSRYAPVSTLASYDPRGGQALVAKPCEANALAAIHREYGTRPDARPPVISFFCAGTPSQRATDSLVEELGLQPDQLTELRYRGKGWPGEFYARDVAGRAAAVTYEQAWGAHLGRELPWRCKLCPDGTGGDADIAVGDYWAADARGFPVFGDAPGVSVAIARTRRGHEWLVKAAEHGILALSPVELDDVARVQPLQSERKQTLTWRLLGRVLAGRPVPRYRGFRLLLATTLKPRKVAKAFLGTVERTLAPGSRRIPPS